MTGLGTTSMRESTVQLQIEISTLLTSSRTMIYRGYRGLTKSTGSQRTRCKCHAGDLLEVLVTSQYRNVILKISSYSGTSPEKALLSSLYSPFMASWALRWTRYPKLYHHWPPRIRWAYQSLIRRWVWWLSPHYAQF